jgi:hypothetical protein
MRLGLVIIIKRNIIGEFVPMNAAEKEIPWNRFRYWLMSKLLPGGGLAGVARLVGSHYEIISIIYRLLRVRARVRVRVRSSTPNHNTNPISYPKPNWDP